LEGNRGTIREACRRVEDGDRDAKQLFIFAVAVQEGVLQVHEVVDGRPPVVIQLNCHGLHNPKPACDWWVLLVYLDNWNVPWVAIALRSWYLPWVGMLVVQFIGLV
jgi:hypothetical protein